MSGRSHGGALDRLVADPATFARTVWGVAPHLDRARTARARERFEDLFSLDDADAFVSRGVRTPAVRMVLDGRILDAACYASTVRIGGRSATDVIDGRKVATQIGKGATLVMQSLHRQWDPIVRFADDLMDEIGHSVQINAYLTPPDSTGLRPHRDPHDVFIVQIDGTKRWWIDGLGDVDVERGDVVYIPAGCEHRAHTTGERSLHLTVGILRTTYRNALDRVLDELADELGRPLPLGFHRTPDRSPDRAPEESNAAGGRSLEIGLARAFDAVVEHLRSKHLADVAAVERRRQLVPLERRGFVRSALEIDDLTPDSVVRWATVEPRMQSVQDDDDAPTAPRGRRVRVLLADRVLRVPSVAIDAIDAIARARHGLRVGDVPGLDVAGRLVLVRRLVIEGACIIEHARTNE